MKTLMTLLFLLLVATIALPTLAEEDRNMNNNLNSNANLNVNGNGNLNANLNSNSNANRNANANGNGSPGTTGGASATTGMTGTTGTTGTTRRTGSTGLTGSETGPQTQTQSSSSAGSLGATSIERTKMSNSFIRQVQQALKDKASDPGTLDGKLGPKTKAAIREFQRANGLPVREELMMKQPPNLAYLRNLLLRVNESTDVRARSIAPGISAYSPGSSAF